MNALGSPVGSAGLPAPTRCEILDDEPDGRDALRVAPIELDERHVSAN
jgi:hypothetical protein